ncbi:MAG: gfo/Idh/MocA family oxidoreductase, partial [Candidatus Hydrogenedentota bacterium]
SGGQLFYKDDHETPDTQIVTYEYDECHLIYEMRLWTNYKLEGHDNGAVFYGDKGKLEMGRSGCDVTLANGDKRHLGPPSDLTAHVRNYLDAIHANDTSAVNAPISEGAVSSSLCHLGNIATRVDRKLNFDPGSRSCKNDQEANALLTKEYRSGYELRKIG